MYTYGDPVPKRQIFNVLVWRFGAQPPNLIPANIPATRYTAQMSMVKIYNTRSGARFARPTPCLVTITDFLMRTLTPALERVVTFKGALSNNLGRSRAISAPST